MNILAGTRPAVIRKKQRSKVSFIRLNKRSRKRLTRWGIVVANFAIVGVVGLIAVQAKDTSPASIKAVETQNSFSETTSAKPLDNLSSADEAVHIARMTGLQEATAVVNKADSVNAQLAVVTTDEAVVAKPQIVGAGLKSKKDIQTYEVAKGDTVNSIAKKFGVSADTIRLSNGITGDEVEEGKKLIISPVNGVVYKVKEGDTPKSIADKYYADVDSLLIFNDAEETGTFSVGERIVIPDGVAPSRPAVAYSGPTYSGASNLGYGFAYGTTPQYGSNGYDFGWCTWHAANRRMEAGNPIPSNLGNAISWLPIAQSMGMPTGSSPQAGAVLYHKNIGGLGHVAYVEKVNSDGSFLVSDMNYPIWGTVTYRTVPASETGNYGFIY